MGPNENKQKNIIKLEKKCCVCYKIFKRKLIERHMMVNHYDEMKEILDRFLKDELNKSV